jgi:nucleoporin GLE1
MSRVRLQTPSTALRPKSMSPKFDDSPSRQLMLDLERALSQTQIHEAELHKVYNYQQRLFQENLDMLDRQRAQQDIAAIDAATSRHETVRKEAEAELHRYYEEVERQERLKREDEERRLREQRAQAKVEAERKAKAEAERKAKGEAERIARIEKEQAAARKAAEDKAKAEQAERQKREEALAQEKAEEEVKQKAEQQAEQEKARLVLQAVEKKAADEKAAEAATQATTKDKQIVRAQGQSSTLSTHANEAQHQRYLQIHQNLKRFRKEFWAQCKKDANMKSKVGDMRRAIKTSVGQLTDTKGANRQPVRSSARDLKRHI